MFALYEALIGGSVVKLVVFIAVLAVLIVAVSYFVVSWEQRINEKRLTGRVLPSNRVLRKITKDIEQGKAFTIDKVDGKWVATAKNE